MPHYQQLHLVAFQNTYIAVTENFEALMFYHIVHIKIVTIQVTPQKKAVN